MRPTQPKLGLYLHIPYCAALCPYCDFAKTANTTAVLGQQYLAALYQHTQGWLTLPALQDRVVAGFSSVFLGGGTPSLYAAEYAPLMELLRGHLQPEAEVTLEANPDDLTQSNLKLWRSLGFNRLSVGMQSFDAAALKILGRRHEAAAASSAVAAALAVFPKLNIDLIYGWPGQELSSWRRDLRAAVALGIPHLSLYCLTYEARTPLGRQAARGVITPQHDGPLADAYAMACEELAAAGYEHEEVSNWAKAGSSCEHNWLYWEDHAYIGIGAGAHGYLPDSTGPGVRYAYPRSDRLFIKRTLADSAPDALTERFGIELDTGRDLEAWLTEVVGSGLRTRRGIDLAAALQRTGRQWRPTPVLSEGFAQGFLSLAAAGRLQLAPAQWFREAGWGVEVLRSVVSESSLRAPINHQ